MANNVLFFLLSLNEPQFYSRNIYVTRVTYIMEIQMTVFLAL